MTHNTIYKTDESPAPPRLALRPREAAIQLGLSEKGLFNATFPRGTLPAVKVGSRVLYFRHQIEKWADDQLTAQQTAAQQQGGAESAVSK